MSFTQTALATADFPGPAWLPGDAPSFFNFLVPAFQPIPVIPVIAALMGIFYLAGAIRLWRSGRSWPKWRTVSFLSGCVILIVVMGFQVEGYGYKMFSVFMFQQLTLMMAVPPLLVMGSPGTLLLRATPHRGLGVPVLRGAVWGLRSPFGRFLLHPAFMIPLFLVSFYGLYLSTLADQFLWNWYGHISLEVLFLIAGILFTIPILSHDPLPRKQGHFGRFIDMFLEMPLHAFFGVVVMMATLPLVSWFATPPAEWGVNVMGDQYLAGGLAWSYGELPSVLMLMYVLVRWRREETRSTRARDRSGRSDVELDDYNKYLSGLDHR